MKNQKAYFIFLYALLTSTKVFTSLISDQLDYALNITQYIRYLTADCHTSDCDQFDAFVIYQKQAPLLDEVFEFLLNDSNAYLTQNIGAYFQILDSFIWTVENLYRHQCLQRFTNYFLSLSRGEQLTLNLTFTFTVEVVDSISSTNITTDNVTPYLYSFIQNYKYSEVYQIRWIDGIDQSPYYSAFNKLHYYCFNILYSWIGSTLLKLYRYFPINYSEHEITYNSKNFSFDFHSCFNRLETSNFQVSIKSNVNQDIEQLILKYLYCFEFVNFKPPYHIINNSDYFEYDTRYVSGNNKKNIQYLELDDEKYGKLNAFNLGNSCLRNNTSLNMTILELTRATSNLVYFPDTSTILDQVQIKIPINTKLLWNRHVNYTSYEDQKEIEMIKQGGLYHYSSSIIIKYCFSATLNNNDKSKLINYTKMYTDFANSPKSNRLSDFVNHFTTGPNKITPYEVVTLPEIIDNKGIVFHYDYAERFNDLTSPVSFRIERQSDVQSSINKSVSTLSFYNFEPSNDFYFEVESTADLDDFIIYDNSQRLVLTSAIHNLTSIKPASRSFFLKSSSKLYNNYRTFITATSATLFGIFLITFIGLLIFISIYFSYSQSKLNPSQLFLDLVVSQEYYLPDDFLKLNSLTSSEAKQEDQEIKSESLKQPEGSEDMAKAMPASVGMPNPMDDSIDDNKMNSNKIQGVSAFLPQSLIKNKKSVQKLRQNLDFISNASSSKSSRQNTIEKIKIDNKNLSSNNSQHIQLVKMNDEEDPSVSSEGEKIKSMKSNNNYSELKISESVSIEPILSITNSFQRRIYNLTSIRFLKALRYQLRDSLFFSIFTNCSNGFQNGLRSYSKYIAHQSVNVCLFIVILTYFQQNLSVSCVYAYYD